VTLPTALELEFADGAYLFDLKLPQLRELQALRECSIFRLYGRVLRGRYVLEGQIVALPHEGDAYSDDIFETIRLGLIGGGKGIVNGAEVEVSALTAKRLVETYCHAAPMRESWAIAAAVLAARIEGYDPGPKAEPAQEPAPESETSQSTSPRSSPTAPSSDATGES
jgi:hypothetical protein